MTRIARTTDGTALLGSDLGFVPADATASAFAGTNRILGAAADGTLDATDATATPIPADHLSFGSPLADYGKLWGIGLNYGAHAADLDESRPNEPASFMKPATAATGPGGPIRLPPESQAERVTVEAELAVVVGRTCRNVDERDVASVVAGYVPVIDVTAEDVLERNPRFLTRAKSFDTFLVFGPWIRTVDTVDSLGEVEVRTVVNGTVRASNTVDDMRYSPEELVAFHSEVMTLQPGDVISTGTPGAHPVSPGDEVRAEVDGVGTATATVVR